MYTTEHTRNAHYGQNIENQMRIIIIIIRNETKSSTENTEMPHSYYTKSDFKN